MFCGTFEIRVFKWGGDCMLMLLQESDFCNVHLNKTAVKETELTNLHQRENITTWTASE